MRTYRSYTDEDVIEAAKKSKSIATLLKAIRLKPAGGNYIHIKKTIQRLKIDTSHWTGQGWNKDQQLKDWSKYTRAIHLKKHLIKVRSHKCEKCSLTHWLNSDIVLEVHHIDGDRTNNELNNLQLLCCNCHATTDNWRKQKAQ
jgi:hypothetical protein